MADIVAIGDVATVVAYAALLIMAAAVATVLRAEDTPKTPWTKRYLGTHVQVFVYGLIAAGVLGYVLDYDLATPGGFVAVLTAAYTGIAGVRALISRHDNEAAEGAKETKV